jgi:hypothetical protein
MLNTVHIIIIHKVDYCTRLKFAPSWQQLSNNCIILPQGKQNVLQMLVYTYMRQYGCGMLHFYSVKYCRHKITDEFTAGSHAVTLVLKLYVLKLTHFLKPQCLNKELNITRNLKSN